MDTHSSEPLPTDGIASFLRHAVRIPRKISKHHLPISSTPRFSMVFPSSVLAMRFQVRIQPSALMFFIHQEATAGTCRRPISSCCKSSPVQMTHLWHVLASLSEVSDDTSQSFHRNTSFIWQKQVPRSRITATIH